MADLLTRPQWAGANADVDVHIEAYQGDVDRAFAYNSYFHGKVAPKDVSGSSNTWRGDRMGTAVVKARGAGVALEKTRIVNEKFTVTVDMTSYIRTAIDYQDEWTAPSRRAEISDEHGSAMALDYDQKHLIQLIHCRDWTAPASLLNKGFKNGLEVSVALAAIEADATLTAAEKGEAKADAIERAHRELVTQLVLRRVPMGEVETLIHPVWYSILMDHKKLLNADFSAGNGDFASRRIGMLNGVKVVELNCFPDTTVDSEWGAAFDVVAEDLLCKMVVWHTQKSIVTVQAQPQVFRIWDDKEAFENVLDTYSMYTVGHRRPDYVGVAVGDA